MFYERLRALRKKRKLTQAQLAEMLTVSPSTVGMYEQGRRKPDSQTLICLCNIFGVSTDYLLGTSAEECPSEDLDVVLHHIRSRLMGKKQVRFRGRVLTPRDIERVFDALDVTVSLILGPGHGRVSDSKS